MYHSSWRSWLKVSRALCLVFPLCVLQNVELGAMSDDDGWHQQCHLCLQTFGPTRVGFASTHAHDTDARYDMNINIDGSSWQSYLEEITNDITC